MDRDIIDNKLNARYTRLNNLTASIEKKLLNLPEGKLRIKNQGNSTYYYYVDKESTGNGTLISPTNTSMIIGLAQRSYLEKVLSAAYDEKKLIERFMKRFPNPSVEQVYEHQHPSRQKLITPIILPDNEYLEQWLNEPYVHKGFDEGMPYYETLNGERVRSKSEAQIADHLRAKNIPYKYECPLIVGNQTFHPDFTILRMSDRKELYYEHLGRMGDPDYARRNINKLNKYALNGYIQGVNLFTTMESAECPFDVRTLDRLIDNNFY